MNSSRYISQNGVLPVSATATVTAARRRRPQLQWWKRRRRDAIIATLDGRALRRTAIWRAELFGVAEGDALWTAGGTGTPSIPPNHYVYCISLRRLPSCMLLHFQRALTSFSKPTYLRHARRGGSLTLVCRYSSAIEQNHGPKSPIGKADEVVCTCEYETCCRFLPSSSRYHFSSAQKEWQKLRLVPFIRPPFGAAFAFARSFACKAAVAIDYRV